jgi:RNA polymerase sigma factor (TIGR02999 family)
MPATRRPHVESTPANLTILMDRAAAGSRSAAAELLPIVYDELRALAQRELAREPAGLTLQATALVHEAYLRLGASPDAQWQNRRHYFGAAAIAMRRILVERARRKAGPKQGGDRARVPLDHAEPAAADEPIDWLALDGALAALEHHDPALAELVSLRYFAGLSVDQAAAALGLSPRTIDRDWRVARAFLQHHLSGSGDGP